MKEIPKCKGTFWTSFIGIDGGIRSDQLKLNRTAKKAFVWRSIILLSIIAVFYTRFLFVSYFAKFEDDLSKEFASTTNYVARNIRSVVQTTTEAATFSTELINTWNKTIEEPIANCTNPAILEFPSDGLTRNQRRRGWIILHILFALYCFWFLAIICDDYFVPAIEQICSNLGLQKDVVGATFMASATSSPELFLNCVGTFVTKGDIGISAIVGSAVFNILAVPACCGIFVFGQFVKLDWWPVTRDCLMYCVAILALIGILNDGRVMWYEALLLVIGYFLYMAAMYHNDKMARTARRLISKYRRQTRPRSYREVTEFTPLLPSSNNNLCMSKRSFASEVTIEYGHSDSKLGANADSLNSIDSNDSEDFADDPWHRNLDTNPYKYACRWPLTLLLWLTIPDSRRHPNCKYLTLLLSICWIGVISYMVAFAITIIGDTFDIPDSVMGITILSAGLSVPETVSSVIVTRQGQGAMGISNSIGSNTFDILLCLGIPWFIRSYFLPINPGQLWVTLDSSGLTYSSMFLLATLLGLYLAFVANRFVLDWKIGIGCSVMYVSFLIIATLIYLDVFFPVNLPLCEYWLVKIN